MNNPYTALSIAGFDGSGGAGIQADLKTFSALGCYGMTVLTALPIQNTCGVSHCYTLPLSAIEDQLLSIFEDIKPNSIKIGMLYNSDIIELVSKILKNHAQNIPIVIDPVCVAKSGHALLLPEALSTLKTTLFPLASLMTPNLPEAESLLGYSIPKRFTMEAAAKDLLALGSKNVLLKGGHLEGETAADLLMQQDGSTFWFETQRIETKNTHGTGCTLSAAIAAYLAQNMALTEACKRAKDYIFHAILAAKDQQLGRGKGPVHHFYNIWPKD